MYIRGLLSGGRRSLHHHRLTAADVHLWRTGGARVWRTKKTPSPTVTARDGPWFSYGFFVPCFFFQRLKAQSYTPSFTCPPTSPWGFSAQLFSWRFSFLILALLWGFMAIYAALRSVESCPDGEQQSRWALLLVQSIKLNTYDAMWNNNNNIWQ